MKVMTQAAIAALAQANQLPSELLDLLQVDDWRSPQGTVQPAAVPWNFFGRRETSP